VVDKLFGQDQPNQLLFSFLEDETLVGYGGLVHIDWENKNAEISFLTRSDRSNRVDQFISDWKNFLEILKGISAHELDFIKIYTYAYDVRPHLYQALVESNFVEEARLKYQVSIKDNPCDVLIHSYFLDYLNFRSANKQDVLLYFNWSNEESVRKNSYNSKPIEYQDHCNWFYNRLSSEQCKFYLFFNLEGIPVGQVRIETNENETTIGVSVDARFRGKSLSSKMLRKSTNHFFAQHAHPVIVAYIKDDNQASYKSFLAAGFVEKELVQIEGFKSYRLIKTIEK
jgi:RimJ/RimL family protein N-acetyltransferase